jgi:hypothetical protein
MMVVQVDYLTYDAHTIPLSEYTHGDGNQKPVPISLCLEHIQIRCRLVDVSLQCESLFDLGHLERN